MISITAHGMASATTESLKAFPVTPARGNTKNARAGTTASLNTVLTTIGKETVGISARKMMPLANRDTPDVVEFYRHFRGR